MQSRMHAIMEARMRQGDLFRIIGNSVKTSLQNTLDNTYDKINHHVIEMCANIESMIETSRGAEATEVLRSHPQQLERVRATLAEARRVSLDLQNQASSAREEATRFGWIQ